jgi:uncharacterized protein (DUF2164 family)
MKIIFLDHDGVICLSNNWGTRRKKWSNYRSANPTSSSFMNDVPVDVRFDDFDKKSVRILNEIIQETDCEIVVSSDWRYHATLQELGEFYIQQGIVKRPVAVTEFLSDIDENMSGLTSLESERSLEILRFVNSHPEITSWVAVDDLDMSVLLADRFIYCISSKLGIKKQGIKEKILELLKK